MTRLSRLMIGLMATIAFWAASMCCLMYGKEIGREQVRQQVIAATQGADWLTVATLDRRKHDR